MHCICGLSPVRWRNRIFLNLKKNLSPAVAVHHSPVALVSHTWAAARHDQPVQLTKRCRTGTDNCLAPRHLFARTPRPVTEVPLPAGCRCADGLPGRRQRFDPGRRATCARPAIQAGRQGSSEQLGRLGGWGRRRSSTDRSIILQACRSI